MASQRGSSKLKPQSPPILSLPQSYEVSYTMIPTLKMKRLKFRDVKQYAKVAVS